MSTSFSFSKATRKGVLENESRPGPEICRVESAAAIGGTGAMAQTHLKTKHASGFVAVRNDNSVSQKWHETKAAHLRACLSILDMCV